jgi:DNA-binding MarR family transcriptional regulator
MSNPEYDPERSFGMLIGDLSRMLRRNFNRHIRDSGVTQSQWQALAFLRRWEGINQAALADLMEVQPISLARLIDRMEAAGWVERRPDPNDRRAVRLFLCDKAQPMLNEMRVTWLDFQASALAGISDAEMQQTLDTLAKIKTNLTDAGATAELPVAQQRR